MRYGSVCSGIEAATAAWHKLGWKPAFFSEIEKFPRAVLAYRYPDVPLHGDFTTIGADDYGAIDLLVGGTPCQDFSVAGLRAGIAGERGNLTLEFIRLVERKKPRVVVWENVPGVLSADGGRAFGAFLGGLAKLGYGFAYRVLDAQHFGVPQRRRRVYVVGYLGDWRIAAAILFERESLLGDITPRRQAREKIAGTIASSSFSGGAGGRPEGAAAGHFQIAPTLSNRSKGGGGLGTDFDLDGGLISHTLRAEYDASYTGDGGGLPLIAGTIAAGAHPGSYNGQDAYNDKLIPISIDLRNARRDPDKRDEVNRQGCGIGDDLAHTLSAGAVHGVAAFKPGQSAASRGIGYEENLAPSLEGGGGGNNKPAIMTGMAVRRIIPLECERLQGFEDNYTLIPWRKGWAADGPRYKALGNSMPVPVMLWLGERIQKIEKIIYVG